MARGYPDYANPVYSLASRNVDFALIETGLIGAPSLDGLGRNIWWENWREGIYAWEPLPNSGVRLPYVHTKRAFIPPCSCRLPAQPGGIGGASQIGRRGYFHNALALGLDWSVAYDFTNTYLNVILWYDTPDTSYVGTLQFKLDTGIVYINSGDLAPAIATVDAPSDPGSWLRMKLVINVQTGYYQRLLLGQVEYDLSSYPLRVLGVTDAGHYRVYLQARCDGGVAPTVDIGHVIYTIDEP